MVVLTVFLIALELLYTGTICIAMLLLCAALLLLCLLHIAFYCFTAFC